MHGSEFLTITGLLGTYEDCVSRLSQPETPNGLTSFTFLENGQQHDQFLSAFRSQRLSRPRQERMPAVPHRLQLYPLSGYLR